jgi:hypothetical protein
MDTSVCGAPHNNVLLGRCAMAWCLLLIPCIERCVAAVSSLSRERPTRAVAANAAPDSPREPRREWRWARRVAYEEPHRIHDSRG